MTLETYKPLSLNDLIRLLEMNLRIDTATLCHFITMNFSRQCVTNARHPKGIAELRRTVYCFSP